MLISFFLKDTKLNVKCQAFFLFFFGNGSVTDGKETRFLAETWFLHLRLRDYSTRVIFLASKIQFMDVPPQQEFCVNKGLL